MWLKLAKIIAIKQLNNYNKTIMTEHRALVSNTIKAKQLSLLKSLSFVNVYDWRLTFWCEVFYWVLLSFSPQFSDLCTPIYYLARQVFHGLLCQFQVPFLMMRTIKAGVKTPKLILRLKSYLKLKQLKQVKKNCPPRKSSWRITWRKNDIEIFFASSEEIVELWKSQIQD